MSDASFQIVFRGKILSGFDRPQVRENLARLFRTDASRIDAILDAPKTVLKTGLSKEAATRYQEALRAAGIMVAAVSDVPVAAAPPPAAPAPESRHGVSADRPHGATAAADAGTRTQHEVEQLGLSVAAVGERLLPAQDQIAVEIDTSALSLAEVGAVIGERHPAPPLQVDISGLELGDPGEPIDIGPRHAPLAVDLSALSLEERPPEEPREPTALQRLLASQVGD